MQQEEEEEVDDDADEVVEEEEEEERETATTSGETTTSTTTTTTTTTTASTTTTTTTTTTEETTTTTTITTTTETTTTSKNTNTNELNGENERGQEKSDSDECDEGDDSDNSLYRVEEVVASPDRSSSVSHGALTAGCVASVMVCGGLISFMLYWGKHSRRFQNNSEGEADIEAQAERQTSNAINRKYDGGNGGANGNMGNRLDGESDEEFARRRRQMMQRLVFLLDRDMEMRRIEAFTNAYRRQLARSADGWAARRRRREELGLVDPLDLPPLPSPPTDSPSFRARARKHQPQRPAAPPPLPPVAPPAPGRASSLDSAASTPTPRTIQVPDAAPARPATPPPAATSSPRTAAPAAPTATPPSSVQRSPPVPVVRPTSAPISDATTSSIVPAPPPAPDASSSAPDSQPSPSSASASPGSTSWNTSSGDSTRITTIADVHSVPSARRSSQSRRTFMRRRAEAAGRRRRRHSMAKNHLEAIVEERETSSTSSTPNSLSSASTAPSLPPRFPPSPVLPPRPPSNRNRSVSDPLLTPPVTRPSIHLSRSAPRLSFMEKKRVNENSKEQQIEVLSSSAPDLHDLHGLQEFAKESRLARSDETGKKKHKSRLQKLKNVLPRHSDRLKRWFRSLFPSERHLDRNIGSLHSNSSIVSAPDILHSLALEQNMCSPTTSTSRNEMPPTPPSVSLMNFYYKTQQHEKETVPHEKEKEKEKGAKEKTSIIIELSATEQKVLARQFALRGAMNGRPPSHSLKKVAASTAKGKIQKKKRGKPKDSKPSHDKNLRPRPRSTSSYN